MLFYLLLTCELEYNLFHQITNHIPYNVKINLFDPTFITQAYKLGVYGKRYQWISFEADFGIMEEINAEAYDGCTRNQLVLAADGAFAVRNMFISDYDFSHKKGVTGKVCCMRFA